MSDVPIDPDPPFNTTPTLEQCEAAALLVSRHLGDLQLIDTAAILRKISLPENVLVGLAMEFAQRDANIAALREREQEYIFELANERGGSPAPSIGWYSFDMGRAWHNDLRNCAVTREKGHGRTQWRWVSESGKTGVKTTARRAMRATDAADAEVSSEVG